MPVGKTWGPVLLAAVTDWTVQVIADGFRGTFMHGLSRADCLVAQAVPIAPQRAPEPTPVPGFHYGIDEQRDPLPCTCLGPKRRDSLTRFIPLSQTGQGACHGFGAEITTAFSTARTMLIHIQAETVVAIHDDDEIWTYGEWCFEGCGGVTLRTSTLRPRIDGADCNPKVLPQFILAMENGTRPVMGRVRPCLREDLRQI
ncbi:hypothetical protein SODALDRAFT_376704 [Sodiomyces alkalinus F11]|uniref:Uncharacterized protein n=1 Tax=Sodiomyces alkalinus (strain CBS 110278 / VKM F-3762 / F11) TaxID=1314773 RepID=A0A3N2Q2M5_SODAK|nr:hypothetical protein SODALDRAFT_376704 [Sodiomyces alkalinus F11]ROT40976.1 hypothetical protein SODALDRAFT_376704 [Sodiomyces alkalinus F11]